MEVESNLREDPLDRAVVHFFMPGMPANFNKLGSELLAWLADTRLPLRIEWRDDV